MRDCTVAGDVLHVSILMQQGPAGLSQTEHIEFVYVACEKPNQYADENYVGSSKRSDLIPWKPDIIQFSLAG
uniref:FRAS1-related extracellular matrix protein 2 n=1 Tax=Angiostrongylus cantonensis TaxID=6313 RepID=A0A0K0CY32_ANGCA